MTMKVWEYVSMCAWENEYVFVDVKMYVCVYVNECRCLCMYVDEQTILLYT